MTEGPLTCYPPSTADLTAAPVPVLGAFVRIVAYCADRKVDRPNNAQRAIYMVWVGYMVVESLVGIVVNQDLRLVRWVGFYMLLGALSSVVHFRGSEFPFPSGRQTALIVVVTTTFLM